MRARKVDLTHGSIRDGLRELGFGVVDLSRVGDDCPDLLCSKHNITFLVECKTPRGKKKASDLLSEGQSDFKDTWDGPVIVAFELQDVLYGFHLLRKRSGWVR